MSKVDVTKPTSGKAFTADVRDNFAIIKAELEKLELDTLPDYLRLSGGTMTGPIKLSGVASFPDEAVQKQYVDWLLTPPDAVVGSGPGVTIRSANGPSGGGNINFILGLNTTDSVSGEFTIKNLATTTPINPEAIWNNNGVLNIGANAASPLQTTGGEMTGGISFGSDVALSSYDCSRHILLYKGDVYINDIGFNITGAGKYVNFNCGLDGRFNINFQPMASTISITKAYFNITNAYLYSNSYVQCRGGFSTFNMPPVIVKPDVAGSCSDGTALKSFLTIMASFGFFNDLSTP